MALTIGTTLGPYAVTARMGEGGMGEVYEARDTKLDSVVTIDVRRAHGEVKLAEGDRRMSVAHRRFAPAVATWTVLMTVSIGALASTAAGQAGHRVFLSATELPASPLAIGPVFVGSDHGSFAARIRRSRVDVNAGRKLLR